MPSDRALRQTSTALAAVTVLFGLGFLSLRSQTLQANITPRPPVTILVYHDVPASIKITVGTRANASVVDVVGDPQIGLAISVPSDWLRREVRGSSLQSSVSFPNPNGTVHWTIPAGSTLSFRIASAIDRLTVAHQKPIPLHVRFARIDLDSNSHVTDDLLLGNEPITLPRLIPASPSL